MIAAVAIVSVGLIIVGLVAGGFCGMWRVTIAILLLVGLGLIPLLWTVLDPKDRCLDSGGRWNEAAQECSRQHRRD